MCVHVTTHVHIHVPQRILGIPRISMPFFLRTRQDAVIRDVHVPGPDASSKLRDIDTQTFMEKIVLSDRPWNAAVKSISDY